MIEFENEARRLVTLEELSAKETWDSEDIQLLVANQDILDDKTLVRLGIKEEPKKKK
jgi:hypothetical protein